MFEKVKEILVNELSVDEEITMETELVNDLGFNSIELANLVLSCEENFDIEVDEKELRKFITVGDIVNYLEEICK